MTCVRVLCTRIKTFQIYVIRRIDKSRFEHRAKQLKSELQLHRFCGKLGSPNDHAVLFLIQALSFALPFGIPMIARGDVCIICPPSHQSQQFSKRHHPVAVVECVFRWRGHPLFNLRFRDEDHRHCPGMNWRNNIVWVARQKAKQLVFAFNGIRLVPRLPCHVVQIPANIASGRSSFNANQVGVFFGLVSAYSQNEVNGTTQRF